jgi:BolA protein
VSVAITINDILVDSLAPVHLDVIDESHRHNVPEGAESHFKLVIVADAFEGKTLVARHRVINTLLAQQLAGPVHALGLHTHTPEEWQARGESVPASPPCRGGGAAS